MQWRLNEGRGKAIYRLGVEDDGRVCGLRLTELESSLGTLERMTKRLNATMSPLRERIITNSTNQDVEYCKAMEFLIQQIPLKNERVSFNKTKLFKKLFYFIFTWFK